MPIELHMDVFTVRPFYIPTAAASLLFLEKTPLLLNGKTSRWTFSPRPLFVAACIPQKMKAPTGLGRISVRVPC